MAKAKKHQQAKVSKEAFDALELGLHADLLAVQRKLMAADFPVILIVSGVEAAGKSAVVNRLNKWLDARGVSVSAFWDESDEERERPAYWRFWRAMPGKARIGVFFGSWYTIPIIRSASGKLGKQSFSAELAKINDFEHMLANDGALIVKFWFHISKQEQASRIKRKAKKGYRITPWEKKLSKLYDPFEAVTNKALRTTDTVQNPWHIVDATDRRHRDLTVGRILLESLTKRLGKKKAPALKKRKTAHPAASSSYRDHLASCDLSQSLTEAQYDKRLKNYQARLAELHWAAWDKKRSTVLIFEGSDAGGKGGAIRRLTAAMDARLCHVIPIAAPTDEERAQHYLWRFWRHIPRAGYVTMYDRSWYGRVLVERVEKFAQVHEWQRAFGEINAFEEQLADSGIVVAKFWLSISPDEQLRRFEERGRLAHKKHKITEEDWRNREKRDDYNEAVNEMIERSSTPYAPWFIIPGNDKKFARVEILKTVCRQLEKALKR
ncbi:MAG: polyphosphate:AMP phosphotransferase [Gammaproteobacteria bacterium]|nr:MAG: polyphosphate:AMP phosphotransferase [Gammaproteobacteria bacterium]